MDFLFVDGDAATHDRIARKRIRSHVMKGKNLGRSIPARGWKNRSLQAKQLQEEPTAAQSTAISKKAPGDTQSPSETNENGAVSPEMPAAGFLAAEISSTASPTNYFAGTEFYYFQSFLPVQFTPSMRSLIYTFNSSVRDRVYPHAFCRPASENHPWFRNMVQDEMLFHCTIAMASTYVSLFRGEHGRAAEAAWHLSETVRLLNSSLSSTSAQHDRILAAVVSLAIHSNVTGAAPSGNVHLSALKRILGYRVEGFKSLRERNPELTQKICRTEFECAIMEGTSVELGSEQGAMQAPGLPPALPSSTSFLLPYPLTDLSPPLQYITRDVFMLCSYPSKQKLDPYHYQDLVITICQRLVGFSSLGGPRPTEPLDDVWQLGLLAFMTTIFYHIGRMRAIYLELASQMLQERLQQYPFSGPMEISEYRPLHFWLFFIHGFSVLDGRDGRWLLPQIRSRADVLHIKTWERAKEHLQIFPWIAEIHDETGKRLFDMTTPSLEDQGENGGDCVRFLAIDP
ncbi:hypothetical protein NKR23_g6451 [Pleurostoma richardsiae]|uniref:Uncharacterized protein n=1 Tax=Pleurostoma richardsiae TaxID=41990 RepID=A0AA38VEA8_9PEZI|nr:hypothetical protein NKR23_g6451 [Pleurostoma richardsiae]